MNWDEFVEQYYAPIYRFCYHILGSREEAEDLTQDTFFKAYRSFSSITKQESVRSWIYSIARNGCIDRKRWWKRFLPREPEGEELQAPASSPDLSMTLSKLIQALPLKQREVFVLRHWHGFSTREVADFLRIDEGTVKSHLKRAVDKLKSQLSDNQAGG